VTEEKDGPVHYQVSVTGRQAAAFFLVLLAALGLSFFFGMKTGAAARRGPDPVSALAAQSDIPVPTVSPADDGGRATPVPTEVPIGFDAPPVRAREASPTPEPPPRDDPRPVVRELAAPTVPPQPKATVAPPRPAEAGPGEAAREAGPFWVQILVTGSAEKADGLSKKLKADGFKSDVSLVPGRKGLFRVRIGPYPDRAKAEAAATKVTKAEKLKDKPIVVPGT
jgi:cell division septation protein DedD